LHFPLCYVDVDDGALSVLSPILFSLLKR
jgi:hypothetical protein